MKKYLIFSVIVTLFVLIGFFSMATAETSENYIEVEGNYLDSGTTRTSGFLYSDSLLLNGSSKMSGDLCKASAVLSSAAYDASYAQSLLNQMGYKAEPYDYGARTLEDNDRVAYTIGTKKCDGYVIYCVAIRGTFHNCEWFSNFNIDGEGFDGNHAGFHIAATKVFNKLNAIMSADGHAPEERILWFTGHSRGAAVANILAAAYTKNQSYATADHIFGYTFACPAVSKNPMNCSNIFNFNNTGDVIISVPLKDWGYGRHGRDYNNAFTGDIEFEMRYYSEVGHEYGATYDTLAYEEIIKTIIPSEDKTNEPLGKFGIALLAWALGGREEVGLDQVMAKYGKDVFTTDYLWQTVLKKTNLLAIYEVLDEDATDGDDMKSFLKNAIDTIETEEDFYVWLMDDENEAMLNRITEATGLIIDSLDDLPSVYSVILKLIPVAWDVGKVIGCVLDITQNGGGNIKESIFDGHRPSAYVLNLNDLYFGYRGHEETSRTNYTIPDCVVTIGARCFENSSITNIEGLDHVEAVGSKAFYNCTALSGDAGNSQLRHVEDKAFYNCSALPISIPGELMKVGESAFYNCTGLTGSITIMEGTKTVGVQAFCRCTGLEEVILPDSLESIEYGAFAACTGLKRLSIPLSCTYACNYWGDTGNTFIGCNAVESIMYTVGNGTVFETGQYNNLPYYAKDSLTTVTYEEGITRIPERALYGCSSVVDVTIPESVISIGDFAFYGCSAWTGSFPIWETTQSIGESAFYKCMSMEGSITIPEGITTIGKDTFHYCSGLTELILPDSVESLGDSAFSCCSGLKKITLPISCSYANAYWNPSTFQLCSNIEEIVYTVGNGTVFQPETIYTLSYWARDSLTTATYEEGINELPEHALYNCGKLTTVNLPTTLTTLSNHAFYGCASLEMIELPNVTSIGDYAFGNCISLVDVTIPESVTAIGEAAFFNCKAWTGSFPIWETTQSIGRSAFGLCVSLEGTVVIPDGITEIGGDTFRGCIGLKEIIIPDSVESIGGGCFSGCTGLRRITMPVSCTYGELTGSSGHYVFEACSNVEEVVYTAGNGTAVDVEEKGSLAYYAKDSLKTVTFEEGITRLPAYVLTGCDKVTTVNLPTTLTAIGSHAFSGCSSLTNLIAPESLTEIGEYAFYGCSSLTNLILSESLTEIGKCAFYECSAWTGSFPIGETTRSIGSFSFYECGNLTGKLTLGDGITEIGEYAFSECIGLEEVILPDSVESVGDGCFYNCKKLKKVTMPISCAYKNAGNGNCSFNTFFGCNNVNEIVYTVGNGTTFETGSSDTVYNPEELYSLPFYARFVLTMVTYGEGITRLPEYALYNCGNVTTVNLPTTLTMVSSYAFFGCDSLKMLEIPESVTSIASNAFSGTADITLLVYENSYAHTWCIEHGVAFRIVGKQLVPGKSAWVLPSSLRMIEEEAFLGLGMQEVVIPEGTISIGKRAFADCAALTYVFIPDSVEEIAADAFENSDAVIIICNQGSRAASFAESAGIEWIAMDSSE